jgi:RNA polymerase sigma factor (TIGR02999 family)
MAEITRILEAIDEGEVHAAEELLPLVYDELRRLAAQKLRREKPGQTLQATALVHEAYIRLLGFDDAHWDGRAHFFAAAAEAMRRILVESARRKQSIKSGRDRRRVELRDAAGGDGSDVIDLIALDQALTALEEEEPAKAQLVKLRFFGGLSVGEAATAMGISRATAKRYWVYARAWLFGRMNDASPDRLPGNSVRHL